MSFSTAPALELTSGFNNVFGYARGVGGAAYYEDLQLLLSKSPDQEPRARLLDELSQELADDDLRRILSILNGRRLTPEQWENSYVQWCIKQLMWMRYDAIEASIDPLLNDVYMVLFRTRDVPVLSLVHVHEALIPKLQNTIKKRLINAFQSEDCATKDDFYKSLPLVTAKYVASDDGVFMRDMLTGLLVDCCMTNTQGIYEALSIDDTKTLALQSWKNIIGHLLRHAFLENVPKNRNTLAMAIAREIRKAQALESLTAQNKRPAPLKP